MRFNLASDWGQVFVGDTVEFVVTLQNVGDAAGGSSPFVAPRRNAKLEALADAAPVNDLVITDELNPAFEIVEATSSNLTVTTTGQKVEAKRATLAGGETVTLSIKVRARDVDVSGKTVLNQAMLSYASGSQPLFSNVVAVKIVAKVAPTPTAAPTEVPTATVAPTAVPGSEVAQLSETKEELGTKLPATSGGTPLWGFVLLGFTLMLHSVRVHRARIRI
jgi:hypothetical protein